MKTIAMVMGLAAAAASARADTHTLHSFRKVELSPEFWSEGCAIGDFNRDGKKDVTAGPFWWEGPDFKTRHEFRPADKKSKVKQPDGTEIEINGYRGRLGRDNDYSDNFYTFVHDLNGDGWDDILVVGMPGTDLRVYMNPADKVTAEGGPRHWPEFKVFKPVENETVWFTDLTGDGKPELVCNANGFFGYAAPGADPTKDWTFHPVTPKGAWHRFTHGLGVGDVNGDGRRDLVEQNGWWEQPASLEGDPAWTLHPFEFAPKTGAAQMLVYDVNGDGLNDVINCLQPHGFGVVWNEQVREGGAISFRRHRILGSEPAHNRYGVKFSQPHAKELADLDGDGVLDLLVGKRFWAHGPTGDVEPDAPAVLYAFRTVRGADKSVDFVPLLVDDNSGVGMHIAAGDLDGDGRPDLFTANKHGIYLFLHETRDVGRDEWNKAQPKPLAP